MRTLISGYNGLIGNALTRALRADGHTLLSLSRSADPQKPLQIRWSPQQQSMETHKLNQVDAVVHLAGESIVGRWTTTKKEAITESRILGTRLLCQTLARLPEPPKTLICASATGFYGDQGDSICTEESAGGEGFLADVCRGWEGETEEAKQAGIRVVNLRIGMVLAAEGGALKQMLIPFRLGLGGRLGSGKQFWSWVALRDLVRIIKFCLEREEIHGPVNAVAPCAVTNAEFTKTLAASLGRPAVIPVPQWAARLVLGEMADALLFCSARVHPEKLNTAGFEFKTPELADSLKQILHG